jgi:16S rRNA (guanine(527)-N(7))-methyltransferase RsmG
VFPELLARCSSLSPTQISALQDHYDLLCRWNKVLNLTTINGLEEAVDRHYCESLFLADRLPELGSFVDVGSGAGFPGFVVAIARPNCSVTLVESHQRKAVFLREASRETPNIKVVAARAETVKGTFDWLVSRAVSYQDLSAVVPRLAPRLALLSGAEEPPASWQFQWENLPLPGGKNRFLRIGGIVSRETN